MKVFNIASGSSGNCTYVCGGNTHILVDVGVSFDEIQKALVQVDITPDKISAILISHEHIDHIKGLKTFLTKKPETLIYAHPKTFAKLLEKCYIPLANQRFILESDFFVGDLTVSAFSLPHDASHCLGFSFFENGKKFSIATDVGAYSNSLIENLMGSDLVFIESNYDNDMLYYCQKYPRILRERISSNFGHLSNDDCSVVVAKLVEGGTQNFALAHISEQTNSYLTARKTVVDYLTFKGLFCDNITVDVLMQRQCGKIYII